MEIVNSSSIDATPIASDNQMAVGAIINALSPGPVPDGTDNSNIRRLDFPDDFIFGTGSSAYQIEGAYNKGGKGLSVWDVFANGSPEKITQGFGTNGNVACDVYNRYKEDIQTTKKMGVDTFRFSIAWSRILPAGRCSGGINREGIDYYNDVIDTILAHDMIPFVTLIHFDTPYCLEKEYGGFLNRKIKDDFREYAELCFWEFGDRVKYWTTINEPYTYCTGGYVDGVFPPCHTIPSAVSSLSSKLPARRNTPTRATVLRARAGGDSGDDSNPIAQAWEAYTVTRNLLLAHAEAVDVYRNKFQKSQNGKIGIVQNVCWFLPFDKDSADDKAACHRAMDFMLGWYLEPVLYGQYPESMKKYVPPENFKDAHFSDAELKMLKGSIDFLGLNYYTSQFAKNSPTLSTRFSYGFPADQQIEYSYTDINGNYIGEQSTGSEWLYVVPKGIYYILEYVNNKYIKDLEKLYITENGYSSANDYKITAREACNNDKQKTKYIQDHLAQIRKAMEDHQNLKEKLKGYFLWSLSDNYEWTAGYMSRFGIIYVDFLNDLTRYATDSALWFVKFLKESKPDKSWWDIIIGKKRASDEGENVQASKRLKL